MVEKRYGLQSSSWLPF